MIGAYDDRTEASVGRINCFHWARSLEKLTVPQLSKKVPAFYGTWRFVIAFSRASQLFLYWARQPLHVLSNDPFQINFYIIFPSTFRSSNCALSFRVLSQHPAFMHIFSPVFHMCSAHLVVVTLLACIYLVTDRNFTPAIQLCLVHQPSPSWSLGCILYIFVVRMRPGALADWRIKLARITVKHSVCTAQ